MDRRQHHADAEADLAGALADRGKRQVRGTVVRPHRAKMMLGKPYARKALLLGKRNLLQRLVDALRFTRPRPGLGDLNLVKQANPHPTVSFLRISFTVPLLACIGLRGKPTKVRTP